MAKIERTKNAIRNVIYGFILKAYTIFVHVVLIMLAFFIQTSIFPLIPFFTSSPNLLLIITFSYGLLHGEFVGLLTGFFCGLLCDMYYDGIFGSFMLLYSLIGFLNGMLSASFVEDSISTTMLFSLVNGLIYNIYIYLVHFFTRQKFNIGYYFLKIMIPSILFTLITTVIIYKFIYKFHLLWKK